MKYALLSAVLLLLASPAPKSATFLDTMQINGQAMAEHVCPRYILDSTPPRKNRKVEFVPQKIGHPESLMPGHNRQILFLNKNSEGPPQAAARHKNGHFLEKPNFSGCQTGPSHRA